MIAKWPLPPAPERLHTPQRVSASQRPIAGGAGAAPGAPRSTRLHVVVLTIGGTTVALYSGGRQLGAEIVQDTLLTAGFRSLGTVGAGPARLDALGTTTVYAAPEEEVRAAWVAAVLGAPLLPLPEGFRPPGGAVAVVAIGDDATS